MKVLPKRWQRLGWMDPRPYYSKSFSKRIPQIMESALRWRVKNVILRYCGGHQLVAIDQYEETLQQLISELVSRGSHVLVLGPPALDERFFPGSQAQQALYEVRAAKHSPNFVSLKNQLRQWDDYLEDHFHPNDSGHSKISKVLMEEITRLRLAR